jgi:hypothetical protein
VQDQQFRNFEWTAAGRGGGLGGGGGGERTHHLAHIHDRGCGRPPPPAIPRPPRALAATAAPGGPCCGRAGGGDPAAGGTALYRGRRGRGGQGREGGRREGGAAPRTLSARTGAHPQPLLPGSPEIHCRGDPSRIPGRGCDLSNKRSPLPRAPAGGIMSGEGAARPPGSVCARALVFWWGDHWGLRKCAGEAGDTDIPAGAGGPLCPSPLWLPRTKRGLRV